MLKTIRSLCEDNDLTGLSISDLFSLYCYLDNNNNTAEMVLMRDILELRIKELCASRSKICLVV